MCLFVPISSLMQKEYCICNFNIPCFHINSIIMTIKPAPSGQKKTICHSLLITVIYKRKWRN